jgi:hypothetical protein
MNIKTKGTALIVLGILGAIFILMFDTIMGKPRNYIGYKSIIALVFCAILIIQGIISLLKKPKA